MDEFDAFSNLAEESIREHFANLGKIADAMTDDERGTYFAAHPPVIWKVAGPSQDTAVAISLN